jgi:hypothetical protein
MKKVGFPHALRLSIATAVAVLGAGCAEMHWQKPGTAQATLDEDLTRCRQEARLRAGQQQVPALATPPVIGADPQGRPVVVQAHQRQSERLLNEQDLTRTCMRDKGYELVRENR